MKFKLLLVSILTLGISSSQAGCIFGSCNLPIRKKIVAYRIINPPVRMITGYKVSPSRISLMIHLPIRNPSLFTRQRYIAPIRYSSRGNAFDTQVSYGGDNLNLSVKNGIAIINNRDYSNRKHLIKSVIPHKVRNLIGRVKITIYGNTIEVSMPRY